MFQFLDGAIKRKLTGMIATYVSMFQFLDGAIKSLFSSARRFRYRPFQFLDGAIKSPTAPGASQLLPWVSIP